MNNFWTIVQDTLKESVSHKKRTVGILVIPLVFVFILSYGLEFLFQRGLFLESFTVMIYQEDEHPMADFLVDQIENDEALGTLIHVHRAKTEKELEEEVLSGRAFAGVVIPKNYVAGLEQGEHQELRLYLGREDPLRNRLLIGIMDSFMYNVSAGQSGVNSIWNHYRDEGLTYEQRQQKIQPVIRDLTLRAIRGRSEMIQRETLEGINSMSSVTFYFHSVLLALALYIALFLGRGIIKEKEEGIYDRVRLSKMKLGTYENGKNLGYFLGVFCYFLLMILAGSVLMGEKDLLKMVVLAFWLGGFFHLFLQVLRLAALGFSDEATFFYLGSFIIFLAVLLGGGIIPFYVLPSEWIAIAEILPHGVYFRGVERILYTSLNEVTAPMLGLLLANFFLTSGKALYFKFCLENDSGWIKGRKGSRYGGKK